MSDSFILSKIVWTLLAPANLFVLMLLLGAFMAIAISERNRRFGRRLCLVLAVVVLLIATLPVGTWLLTPLENRFPSSIPQKVDGIILLAGDENPWLTETRQQPTMGSSANRYLLFSKLARQYPHAKLAFVGGTNEPNPSATITNAKIARETIEALGLNHNQMTFEDQSRNTFENAVYSYKQIQPQPEQNWLLVTSAFHMPRAMLCFQKAGWNVYPVSADYRTSGHYHLKFRFNLFNQLIGINFAAHEYYGLLSYWLMGRIKRPW